MPLYAYNCLKCEAKISIRHSYKAKDIKCIECGSKNIKKNLSNVLQVTKKCYNIKEPIGSQVKKAIEDGKLELETQKKQKQKRVYKNK